MNRNESDVRNVKRILLKITINITYTKDNYAFK